MRGDIRDLRGGSKQLNFAKLNRSRLKEKFMLSYMAFCLAEGDFLLGDNLQDLHILRLKYTIDGAREKLSFVKRKEDRAAKTLCGHFTRQAGIAFSELEPIFLLQKDETTIQRPALNYYSVNFIQVASMERFRLFLARKQSESNLCGQCVAWFYAWNDL
jgi:hypothetical protein